MSMEASVAHSALLAHMEKFTALTPLAQQHVVSSFSHLEFGKKQLLMDEGHICRQHFFVVRGCLRMFFRRENGVEQTTQFAIENWWMTDNMGFERKAESRFSVQAVEASEVLAITWDQQERLLADVPALERYFRFVYQRAYAASLFRLRYLFDYSKETMYRSFLEAHPDFVQRVPQYLLASFLGLTPEYLSEIRKRIS